MEVGFIQKYNFQLSIAMGQNCDRKNDVLAYLQYVKKTRELK